MSLNHKEKQLLDFFEMPIIGLSDRVLVLSHGQITGEFDIKDTIKKNIKMCSGN